MTIDAWYSGLSSALRSIELPPRSIANCFRNACISTSPSMANVDPGMLSTAASIEEKVCKGWKAPGLAPRRRAGSSTSSEAAPEQWSAPWPSRHGIPAATGPMASSGVVMKATSDTSAASLAVG